MTNRKNYLLICIILLLVPMLLTGCSNKDEAPSASAADPKSHTYFIFDTVVTVRLFDSGAEDRHFQEIEKLLKQIDQNMSRTLKSSEIYRVNGNAGQSPAAVSKVTYDLVERALTFAEKSGGKFDPTVAPLVDLWRIGEEDAFRPAEEDIRNKLDLVHYEKVEMNEDDLTIYLPDAGMGIDLGAIAKGYAADEIASYLRGEGLKSAIIDLGGNILAMGEKPNGQAWNIGIQAPDDPRGTTIGSIQLRDQTVVTSGVYERFFIEDGVRYHHILDTETGYPVVNELDSVTIITDNSANADAMSTTTFALGLEQGMAFIEGIDKTDAIFITSDRRIYTTSGLKDRFQLTDDSFEFAN